MKKKKLTAWRVWNKCVCIGVCVCVCVCVCVWVWYKYVNKYLIYYFLGVDRCCIAKREYFAHSNYGKESELC